MLHWLTKIVVSNIMNQVFMLSWDVYGSEHSVIFGHRESIVRSLVSILGWWFLQLKFKIDKNAKENWMKIPNTLINFLENFYFEIFDLFEFDTPL